MEVFTKHGPLRRIFPRVWRVGVPLLLVALVSPLTPALAQTGGPTIADGEWKGTFDGTGGIIFGGTTTGTATWQGDMEFASVGGQLDGDFTITITTDVTSSSASGTGTGQGTGTISGSADQPQLQADQFDVTATASAYGYTVNDTESLPADGIPLSVNIVSATCSQAVGDFSTAVESQLASMGFASVVDGAFVATRTSDLMPGQVPDYQAAVSQLASDAIDFKQAVQQNNAVDWHELDDLLDRAEALAAAIRQNDDCGFTTQGQFILPLTNIVAELIDFALNNPQYFTSNDLTLLALAGLRVGAIGSGAVNAQQAAQLEKALDDELTSRLNSAKASGDCGELQAIAAATAFLNDPGLSQAAGDAYTSQCAP